MGCLGGFDSLEAALLREFGSGEIGGKEGRASPPRCGVELLSEERK